ncbi:MAG: orotate phosphoribosyltransferase [Chitinispirillaceae bacterium]|nr:orotate phosphoribosyltransferase [Chitinispirillaceae bacterium]
MESYKEQFIEFMVRSGVLTFGDFTTKSGRKTPFFINTGNYSTGKQLVKLGRFYAEAIQHLFPEPVDVLFGPAYKGIPLVTAAAMTLSIAFNRQLAFCFNRKEVKDHGEGGTLIGHRLRKGDRIVIVEDVTTAGTSVRESIPLLRAAAEVEVVGLIVSVDRMERGTTPKSALTQLRDEFSIRTGAIVSLDEIIDHLYNREIDGSVALGKEIYEKIADYRATYGASSDNPESE